MQSEDAHTELPADPEPERRHQEFSARTIHPDELAEDPLLQFGKWLEEASRAGEADPFAMTLSTVGPEGAPSSRTVDLKAVDRRGFVFTTSYESPKAREMERDPRASLVFYWPSLHRQVRVQGVVSRIPARESARYFHDRPRDSRLALHAFAQSQVIDDRAALEDRFEALKREYEEVEIPMPDWGGFVLAPSRVELWKGHSTRLHDRFRYEKQSDGSWIRRRLAP